MRRKVNNSEIHEIKKYYKVPSEKVQEWSDTIEELTKQIDRYKAENEQLKEERESMISDYQKKLDLVHMLKDEINELKQENEKLSKLKEIKENALKGANYIIENQKAKIKRLEEENERKDKLIEALKASESNLWHGSIEFEEENRKLKAQRDNWEKEYYEVVDENDRFREVEEENEEYRKESEQLKIKNEYLLNVIKMSENIEIHSDAYDEMEKGACRR